MSKSSALKEAIKLIESLTDEEKKQLYKWIIEENQNRELSDFSYLTSHTVLEKEWLNPEEDKAWANL